MKEFFKYMLATVAGLIVTSILMTLIFIIIISAIVSSAGEKTVTVKKNSVLEMKLDKEITDRSSNNPMDNFDFRSMTAEPKLGLNDILENIDKAKTDDKIKGIYLEITAIPAGIATIEEIRNALLKFKESGKFIIAYSDLYTQAAYYLCSVADKVYLNPQGLVEFKGLRAELMFFKGALEKLGIEPQVIRHGKFKSAIEPFILDKMSPENREQTLTYMQSIWNTIVDGISKQRKVSVQELNLLADSMKIEDAQACLDNKLVDGLMYKDELLAELHTKSGNPDKDLNEVEFISLSKYNNSPKKKPAKGSGKNKIAVIYAVGQIDMGKGDEKAIGSDGLSEAIRDARKDTTIKAVVLRVNSPGGSALASEVIWREVMLTKKVKPVIVSMGDVAASGGYYIACPADVIVADPNTITGSIGVFGLMFNGQKFMNEKIGITIDRVTTNAHSDIGSVFRPLTAAEREVIQEGVEKIYDVFITHVAEGRKMTKAQVDSIGQGRVWSGVNAKEIGLVDEFGGLEQAIVIAAKKAKLENYKVVSLPKQEDPFQAILKSITGDVQVSAIKKELGVNYKYYKMLQEVLKMQGIQARMPYNIDIY